MKTHILIGTALLSALMQPVHAMPVTNHAIITGGGGNNARCTIEVNVDGAAEVEISGATGVLRTLSGQQATWQRFQCNEPLPRNPVDFRLAGVFGRGSIRLIRDPRNNFGNALFHINDPQPGRAVYTFEYQWLRSAGGGWPPTGPNPAPAPSQPGQWHGHGGPAMATAIRICQDAVTSRLNRDGYSYVTFDRTIPNNGPGNNDWVIGTVRGRRGREVTLFSFSCSADFSSGRVRSVDVRR